MSRSIINLDNAADTPVCEAARQAFLGALTLGNPSSPHGGGRAARQCLEEARSVVQTVLDCERAVFTSGGTESINLALRGAAEAYGKLKKHIVTTTLEHPATVKTLSALKAKGFLVTEVPPRDDGRIHPEDILGAVTDNTFLVTAAWVCGETGSLLDIEGLTSRLRGKGVLLHIDGVQGFMKFPVSVRKTGIDLLSVSGHKVHAPMGIGALAISPRVRLVPQITGGEQEGGLRGGTEPLPLAAAFAAAIRDWMPVDPTLVTTAAETLTDAGWFVIPSHDAPILSAANPAKLPGEAMVRMLSDQGIWVGSGSACSRGKRSAALLSMKKLPAWAAGSVIRLSFSRFTVREELSSALEVITRIRRG
ncbi:MAG: aminotransferase class V-fold PLP-dependent enzyme [Oscillospiraceae bacterium]|jgi:cysteine desulfurase|nr:aminotransferase class V-fold PLP-dependent enzyme [Oscillospiraceae bacterium]